MNVTTIFRFRVMCLCGIVSLFSLNGSLLAAPTTADQARKVVQGWLKGDATPLGANMGKDPGEIKTYSDAAGQPAYFVVYLKPTGFVVVPADDGVEPIIAFVREGIYDSSPANPLGAMVSKDVPGRIAAVLASSGNKGVPLAMAVQASQTKWADLQNAATAVQAAGLASVDDERVAPLIASKWNQTDACGVHCYNYYTPGPYYPCGCVATAMAQLMRFYEHPTMGIGMLSFNVTVNGTTQRLITRGGDGTGGSYNWTAMTLAPDSDCSNMPDTNRQAIGALCYDAGLSVNMEYAEDQSGASTYNAKKALTTTFGYSNAVFVRNYASGLGISLVAMVNPNLDSGCPAYLGITGPLGGHAIVVDGYGYNSSSQTLYHHLNMGWGGRSDAWYNLPDINSSPYVFNIVDECIYNIYKSGAGEIISGRVTYTDDAGTHPISGATVTALRAGGTTYSATTNARGIYALSKLPSSSTYTIDVRKAGYGFRAQSVTTGLSADNGSTSGNKWGINFVASAAPPTAQSNTVDALLGATQPITLQADDEGAPDPPAALTYVITSLPAHGTLSDPGGGSINTVRYALLNNGNKLTYTPNSGYTGSDSFTFVANDGGTSPAGGDSNNATITVTVLSSTTVTIGSGTSSWSNPMCTYYHDSRTQVIYLASDLGHTGYIKSLALNVQTVPGQTMNNWTIRMRHTDLSVYSSNSFEPPDAWTTVYQTNESVGATGWWTYNLTTPFYYNGTANLMIDFSYNNSATNYVNGYCYASSPGGARSLYASCNSANGDPLQWPVVPPPTATRTYSVPNVKVMLCGEIGVPVSSCSTPTTATNTALANITWTATDGDGSGVNTVELWYRKGTGGTWTSTGKTGTGTSGTFPSWTPPDGDGTYYIRSQAMDLVGNVEMDLPANGDCNFVYDTGGPTVTITSPTSDPTFSNMSSTIDIGGTASDSLGVTQVTWSNDRGGSGACIGTTNWIASGIGLLAGVNVITVTARDAGNNTATDTLTVTCNPCIAPTITQQPTGRYVCLSENVMLTAGARGTTPLQYQWYKGATSLTDDAHISGATTGTLQIASVASGDAGNYKCVVTNACGAAESNAAALSINTGHPADANYDWQITISELTAYGATWKNSGTSWPVPPNPIPVDYVTKCGQLWMYGENYHCVSGGACPAGCWAPDAFFTVASAAADKKSATMKAIVSQVVRSTNTTTYTPGTAVQVSITIIPSADTQAYAVEETPPAGWTVSSISDEGVWDSRNGKIKWGLFFGATEQTLTYEMTPPAGETDSKSLTGIGSFDGTSITISGTTELTLDSGNGGGGGGGGGTPPPTMYTLVVNVIGGHGTVVPAGGSFAANTTVTLTATPADGYRMKAWTGTLDDNSTVTTNQMMVTGNQTVTVEFEPIPLIVSVGAGVTNITAGGVTTLTATVSGGLSPYLYQWTPMTSLSSAVTAETKANPTVTTTYEVVVTDALGQKVQASVTITVIPVPPPEQPTPPIDELAPPDPEDNAQTPPRINGLCGAGILEMGLFSMALLAMVQIGRRPR